MMRLVLFATLLGSVALPARAAEIGLEEALALARIHDPDLRIQEELAFQSTLIPHRAWAGLSPTLGINAGYTWNDPVVAFDMGEGFESIGTAFGQQGALIGFSYFKLIQEGLMTDFDCRTVADIYGFEGVTDCGGLQSAMLAAAEDQPDSQDESEPIYITPRHQFSLSLNAGWWFSPRLGTQLRMAQAARDAGIARSEFTASRIRYGIYQLFVGLYRAQEEETIAEEALDVARRHLELEQARFEVGSVDETAVLRQQAEVLTAEQGLLTARSTRALAAQRLARRIGSPTEELTVTEPPPVADRWLEPEALADLDRLIRQAEDKRPDMEARRKDIESAKNAVTDSALSWLPNVNFNFSWSDGRGRQGGEWLVPGFSDRSDSLRFNITAVWDLWDGGNRIIDSREAASRRRAARYSLEAGRAQLQDEVFGAAGSLRTALAAVESAEARLEVARRLLDLTEQRVALGSADQLELADARMVYRRARLNSLYSRLAVDDAAWQLELALGER